MGLLQNKNAVITGGSDGVGLGIARAFAENDANLILIGREMEKLKRAKDDLSGYNIRIHLLSADLSDTQKLAELSEQVLAVSPQIDVLVNNAGMGQFAPFSETDISLLDLHLNLNVKAPYFLTQHLLPSLVENYSVPQN